MKVSDIEIPYNEDRGRIYRFFEMLPALLSYSVFLLPFILSFFSPSLAAYFLILYVLIWFTRAIATSVRVFQGYSRVKQARRLDWLQLLRDLKDPAEALKRYGKQQRKLMRVHAQNLEYLAHKSSDDRPEVKDIVHAVVIATYNETQDIIHPTIESILASNATDLKKNVAFFIAYEERAGETKKQQSLESIDKYREHFMYSEAIMHTVQGREVIGKGANATHAGRRIAEWAKEQGIDPANVLITVLDADNRPDPNYLAALTYTYIISEDRKYKSYQPIAMYTNNIWDVPAIMRMSAVNNSFFHTANAMRLHMLRNFSAHSQSLDALIDADFWSMRTVVEDGHQFWRMYFRYDSKHEAVPLYTPIFQDAVLAETYRKTMVAQYKQIRRWTYGASDVAYVATRAFFIPNDVPKLDAALKFLRLLENHVTWASSSLLLVVAGWIPLLISQDPSKSIVALQLPSIMSNINLIGVVIILSSMYIGFATLPPKPKHYHQTRRITFLFQWLLIPVVGVVFNSFAAYESQTRLLLGKYFDKFDVTEKAVKKHSDTTA